MTAERQRLDDERQSITHHFMIRSPDGERDFYLTVGMYADGRLGEIFIKAGKEGSFSSAALDALACAISIGVQHGIPVGQFTTKLRHIKCEPAGLVTGAPEELAGGHKFFAQSPIDYIAAYLDWRWPSGVLRGRADAACGGEVGR